MAESEDERSYIERIGDRCDRSRETGFRFITFLEEYIIDISKRLSSVESKVDNIQSDHKDIHEITEKIEKSVKTEIESFSKTIKKDINIINQKINPIINFKARVIFYLAWFGGIAAILILFSLSSNEITEILKGVIKSHFAT